MSDMKRYRKRSNSLITAVKLEIETSGFVYEKWGGTQTCKAGDWIVDNDGDIYRVTDTPGRYMKSAQVLAEKADKAGSIATKEGVTNYEIGDYLVYNDAAKQDGYAVTAAKFEEMYESVE